MFFSKKKSSGNGKNTPKAHGKRAVAKCFSKFKEIEQIMTTAQPVILSDEDEKNFMDLNKSIKKSICPQNEIEKILVNQIVCFLWKLERLKVITEEIHEKYTNRDGETGWCDLLRTNDLEKIVRYGKNLENYLLKLIYRFKKRPVLALPRQQKIRV